MGYFLQSSLRLHLKLLKRPIIVLLITVLTALFVSTGVAALGNTLLAGRQFSGMQIAVADQNANLQGLSQFEQFAAKEDPGYYVSIVPATEQDALAKLRRGDVAAALVLPDKFMASLYTDAPLSPKLYLDPSRPLEMLLAKTFVESAFAMLSGTKDGVNFVVQVYDQSGVTVPERPVISNYIRLEFSYWMLGRDTTFRNTVVSPTGSLGTGQHYLLGTICYFSLLTTPILFSIYSFRRQKAWADRLRSSGGSLRVYGLSKIICGATVTAVLLALLLSGAAIVGNPSAFPSPSVLVGLLVCSLFLSCFAFLCCNSGSVLSATVLTFLLGSAGLFLSGGLIPPMLLPAAVRNLVPYSPLSWMRDALAPVFGLDADWGAVLALFGFTVLLFMACMLYCWRLERRWKA